MDQRKKGYELSGIVYRYLTKKITENLRKLYLDIDYANHRMLLTAYFRTKPSEIELDLLDDIVTNSNAPIPDFFIEAKVELMDSYEENRHHDYLIFAFFDESEYDL